MVTTNIQTAEQEKQVKELQKRFPLLKVEASTMITYDDYVRRTGQKNIPAIKFSYRGGSINVPMPIHTQADRYQMFALKAATEQQLEAQYPNLYLSMFIGHDGTPELSVWAARYDNGVRRDGQGMTQENYSLTDPRLHEKLAALEAEAVKINAGTHFLCNCCFELQQQEQFAFSLYAGRYCKDCEATDSRVQMYRQEKKYEGR